MINGNLKAFNTNNWVHIWHNDKLIVEDVRTVAELKKALEPYMEFTSAELRQIHESLNPVFNITRGGFGQNRQK